MIRAITRPTYHYRLLSSLVRPAKPHRTHLPTSNSTPTTHTFYHKESSTFTYLVFDPEKRVGILIDTALDFDINTCTVKTTTADGLLAFIKDEGILIEKILDTHAHADHLSAAQYLKDTFKREEGRNVSIGIGKRIIKVQEYWGERLGIPREEMEGAFDHLWEDDERFQMGSKEFIVRHLPGHTPDSVAYQAGNIIFCGDSIFLPDVGSARADFPGGSTKSLFESTQKLLSLPPETRIFSGHDYPGSGRVIPSCSSTVEEQLEGNLHLKKGTRKDEFIEMREKRDKQLREPTLLYQALQINLRGGKMPKDGFIKLPLKIQFGSQTNSETSN